MSRSKSSSRWLQEHFNDVYVKRARTAGYRSRAVYKLQEVDEKEKILKPGMTVIDLGAAPGSWTQYVVEKLNGRGTIVALDLLPMDALPEVHCIQGDFREDSILQELQRLVPLHHVDVILSDMAPNMSGNAAIDMPSAMYLAELALEFSCQMLKPRGTLLLKIFHGEGFDEFVKKVRNQFKKVVIRKPSASRPRSRETYLLAKDYNL